MVCCKCTLTRECKWMQCKHKVLQMIGATFLLGMCLTEGQFVSRLKQNTQSQCIDTRKTIFIRRMRLKVRDSALLSAVVKIDSFWQPDAEIQVTVGHFMPFDSNKSLHFYRPYSQTQRENARNAMRSGFFCVTETTMVVSQYEGFEPKSGDDCGGHGNGRISLTAAAVECVVFNSRPDNVYACHPKTIRFIVCRFMCTQRNILTSLPRASFPVYFIEMCVARTKCTVHLGAVCVVSVLIGDVVAHYVNNDYLCTLTKQNIYRFVPNLQRPLEKRREKKSTATATA